MEFPISQLPQQAAQKRTLVTDGSWPTRAAPSTPSQVLTQHTFKPTFANGWFWPRV
jgi:hypothetical protein